MKRSFLISMAMVLATMQMQAGAIHVTTSAQAKAAYGNGGSARPGDTVWVHGGTYTGAGYVNVSGSAAAPIIIRNWNNERAIIDAGTNPNEGSGGMFIEAGVHDVWFWGLELQSFGTDRSTTSTGSAIPTDINIANGVFTKQSAGDIVGLRFINMQVHDVQQGFSWWIECKNSEVSGCLIYNIGWQSPDRGHGHGIYTQNRTGRKTIADNIMFNGFSHNIHAYGSADAYVDNITVDGNISFNAAYLSTVGGARNILIGTPAQSGMNRIVGDSVLNNHSYFTPTIGGNESGNLGYDKGHDGVKILNNWWTTSPGGMALNLINSINVTMSGNRFYGSTGFSLGSYPANSYNTSTPTTGDTSFIRPNKYESGRANIVVYNWSGGDSVSVNIAGIVKVGGPYRVYNAQNFYGDPTFNGTYTGGKIKIPMRANRWTVAAPNGRSAPASTFPKFGAFVIIGQAPGGPPPPTPPTGTVTAAPTSLPFGGGQVTFTTSSSNATSAILNPGSIGIPVNGSIILSVTSTTSYTTTLSGPGGVTSLPPITVTVAAPPNPTGSFTAVPDSVPFGGGQSVLQWSFRDVTSVSIDQGIGPVPFSGSLSVMVNATKTFRATGNGPGGSIELVKTVVVRPAPPAIVCNYDSVRAAALADTGKIRLQYLFAMQDSVKKNVHADSAKVWINGIAEPLKKP